MNRAQKTSGIVAAVLAATSAAPAAHAWAATHSSASTKVKKYTGPFEDNRWGGVQVKISVKNKKITSVSAAIDPHTQRSVFIDQEAIPLLKQEVLQAQSVTIDLISGATDTSLSYQESLQGAVKKAVKAKTLPAKALSS
jgi:uncharacterized protein with FMN-binding domain